MALSRGAWAGRARGVHQHDEGYLGTRRLVCHRPISRKWRGRSRAKTEPRSFCTPTAPLGFTEGDTAYARGRRAPTTVLSVSTLMLYGGAAPAPRHFPGPGGILPRSPRAAVARRYRLLPATGGAADRSQCRCTVLSICMNLGSGRAIQGCAFFVLEDGDRLGHDDETRPPSAGNRPDAARSGFLPRRSYVAPSPQRRSLAKRPKVELNPRPI